MATFSVGGLASGMDTNTIIDKLVELEKTGLTQLQARQKGLKVQVSALADIISSLTALDTAAKALATDGVLGLQVTSTHTAFSVQAGSSASAGRYQVETVSLARAAKWRSDPFAAGVTTAGGTYTLTVQGKDYGSFHVDDQTSLEDVAAKLRATGAPISATVLNDGTDSYLSVTARDTGYTGADPAAALAIGFTADVGATGQVPGLVQKEAAVNAVVKVDGLSFTRQTNVVADALPGATLTLKSAPAAAEDVVLSNDASATQAKLQKFLDAYNAVNQKVQRQLAVTKDTDRSTTLAGDSSVRALQGILQRLGVTEVNDTGASTVRSLADLGVKTGRDGTLTIDATILGKAISREPAAVNALFAKASTGLAAVIKSMVASQTQAATGVLTSRQDGLNATIKRMDAEVLTMTRRVDAFRATLVQQFTAMEEAVSKIKNSGNQLSSFFASYTAR